MKFTHKILLMPLLTALVLAVMLWGVWYASRHSVRLIDRVEEEFTVYLTVSHDLETLLIQVPPALQSAMTAEDPDLVVEADVLRDRYLGLVDSLRGRPDFNEADLDRATARFTEYYSLARGATLAMIDSGLDVPESVFHDLLRMNTLHEELLTDLRDGAETLRATLATELQGTRDMARTMRRTIVASTMALLLLLFVVSLAVTTSILRPLHSIRDATEAIAQGDLHQRLDYRSEDDLGRLADAFRRMQHHLIMDIDRREKAESALRASEERLALAFDAASDGLWDLDPRRDVIYSSPRYVEMLGYTAADVPSSLQGIQALIHPEDRGHVDAGFAAHMEHDFPFDVELRMRRRDGEWRWFHMRGKIVERTAEGRPARVVGTLVDIATRKRAEEQLFERTQELEDALVNLRAAQTRLVQQAKMASLGQMVAGLAHELNNPVGAVSASADLSERARARLVSVLDEARDLEALRGDPRLARALDALRESARNLVDAGARITGQLQDLKHFTRLDEAEVQRADLIQGLENTLSVIKGRLDDRITVKRDYGELPPVVCNPGEINQVFLNLLTNAAEAIEGPGVITVTARAAEDRVRISVGDTGRGIPPERLDTLFDPSFTAGEARVKMGWGLATVLQIVKRHEGEVTVESRPGEGSVFTVCLPVKPS
jgi:PAS domain S-box-containing protein